MIFLRPDEDLRLLMVRLETIKNKTGLGQSEGLCKIVVLLLESSCKKGKFLICLTLVTLVVCV